MINLLLIKTIMLKIQHQGVPERSLKIIDGSTNGNPQLSTLSVSRDLWFKLTSSSNPHFDVLFISVADITMLKSSRLET